MKCDRIYVYKKRTDMRFIYTNRSAVYLDEGENSRWIYSTGCFVRALFFSGLVVDGFDFVPEPDEVAVEGF